MKKRIAIVNQRYGVEVNGGSELLTRMFAERLTSHYDVEVLTTCALDYMTWENYYPEGEHVINDVSVRRFSVDKMRDIESFNKVYARLLTTERGNKQTEQEWIDSQGPYCPKLIEYIIENEENYDVFIFVTYLFYLTVRGIGLVQDKAILNPTAHDEPPIYFDFYKDIFACPRVFAYNTEEERDFLNNLFQISKIPGDVVGIGIDIPENVSAEDFKNKYDLDNYILYAGRIDHGKNCPELFNYFAAYKIRNPSDLKLVLIGNEVIDVPKHPDIISLGFVSDEDRTNAMAGAKLFVLPSIYESLSMVVLESFALGVPVVVNGKSAPVKGHCLKSNAGLYYTDYYEFEGCINYLLAKENVYQEMSENAKGYIEQNYRWDVIMDKLKSLIEMI